MLCPVCRQALVIVEYRQIELDACPDCHGLWFDAQELRQLFELLDAGGRFARLDAELERLPHQGLRRQCPRCLGRLRPARAPRVPDELILDECPREHGIWFDQGELNALLTSALEGAELALADVREYLGRFVDPAEKK